MLAVVIAMAGCAGSADRTPSLTPLPAAPSESGVVSGGTSGPGATSAPSTAPANPTAPGTPAVPDSPVTGVVISVDSAGLADVRGFALRTFDGVVVDLTIGRLENGAEFPPGHLAEHIATLDPVRVFFRNEGGRLVVYRIEDAR